MGGGGGQTQRQTVDIPAELRPLYSNTARQTVAMQNAMPLMGRPIYATPSAPSGGAGAPVGAPGSAPPGASQPAGLPQLGTGRIPEGTDPADNWRYLNDNQLSPAQLAQRYPGGPPGPRNQFPAFPEGFQPGGAQGAAAPQPEIIGYEGGFTNPNVRGVAGLTGQQQQARTLADSLGRTPDAQARATQFASQAPGVAGRVAQGYQSVLQAPNETAAARQAYQSLPGIAGAVPQEFLWAMQQAQALQPIAGRAVPGQYQGATNLTGSLRGMAEQTPEQFATATQAAQAMQGFAGNRQGEFGGATNLALGMIPAAAQVPGEFGAVRQEAMQNFGNIGRGDISQAPTLLAAQRAFEENVLPQIQNQAALAGLGRSTATSRAQSAANAQMMLPLIQEEFARQERGVNLGAELGLQEATARERGITRGIEAGQFGVGAIQAQGAEGERALERQLQTGQFGVQTGLEEAAARERALGRGVEQGNLQAQRMAEQGAAEERRTDRQLQTGQFGVETRLQQALGQERGVERRANATLAQAQGMESLSAAETARRLEMANAQERATARQAEAMLAATQPLLQSGQMSTDRLLQQIAVRQAFGQEEQAVAQARNDADYEDFLRRQGLAETALFQPLGGFIPSSLGQTVKTSGGGGLLGK